MLSFLWQEVWDRCKLPMFSAIMTHDNYKGVYNSVERLLFFKTWKYLTWCLREWRRKEEGRLYYLPHRDWRRNGQRLRCVTGSHLVWLAMFSEQDHFRLGKSWCEVRWNEVRWCSVLLSSSFIPLLLEIQEKKFQMLSAINWIGYPDKWVLFPRSGYTFSVYFPSPSI